MKISIVLHTAKVVLLFFFPKSNYWFLPVLRVATVHLQLNIKLTCDDKYLIRIGIRLLFCNNFIITIFVEKKKQFEDGD